MAIRHSRGAVMADCPAFPAKMSRAVSMKAAVASTCSDGRTDTNI